MIAIAMEPEPICWLFSSSMYFNYLATYAHTVTCLLTFKELEPAGVLRPSLHTSTPVQVTANKAVVYTGDTAKVRNKRDSLGQTVTKRLLEGFHKAFYWHSQNLHQQCFVTTF